MTWAQKIAAARETFAKAQADAQAMIPKDGTPHTAEKHEAFMKAVKDATDAGRTVQQLQAQEQMEQMQNLSEGELAPELSAPGSGLLDPTYVNVRQALEMRQRQSGLPRGRQMTEHQYRKRYGVGREQHNAVTQALLQAPNGTYRDLRNFGEAFISEEFGLTPGKEKHLHAVFDDSLGGFLVGEDFRAQLIEARAGFTTVRASGAEVVQTAKPGVSYPVLNRASSNPKQYITDMNQGNSNWRPEGFTSGGTARTPQNKPTFGLEYIPVHNWQPDPVEMTQDFIDDADLDPVRLISRLFGHVLGMDEDVAFLRGDGVGKPEGIANSGATTVTIASAATYATPTQPAAGPDNGFSYRRIVDMAMALAAQYRQRASWFMNSDTFGRLLWLAGSDGHPLFPMNAMPGTLLNRPMYFTEFLDNGATSGNTVMLFGDPSYYIIAERRSFYLVRLDERFAPNIAFQATSRLGGQLVLKEAFRIGLGAA